jgi:hypothetical protein
MRLKFWKRTPESVAPVEPPVERIPVSEPPPVVILPPIQEDKPKPAPVVRKPDVGRVICGNMGLVLATEADAEAIASGEKKGIILRVPRLDRPYTGNYVSVDEDGKVMVASPFDYPLETHYITLNVPLYNAECVLSDGGGNVANINFMAIQPGPSGIKVDEVAVKEKGRKRAEALGYAFVDSGETSQGHKLYDVVRFDDVAGRPQPPADESAIYLSTPEVPGLADKMLADAKTEYGVNPVGVPPTLDTVREDMGQRIADAVLSSFRLFGEVKISRGGLTSNSAGQYSWSRGAKSGDVYTVPEDKMDSFAAAVRMNLNDLH